MTQQPDDPGLPTGQELESAIDQALAGRLPATDFAAALTAATLMLAVVGHEEADDHDAAVPFVIEIDDAPYGVAFTSPRQWDTFSAQTPFVLLDGTDLGRAWPAGLGLALNPGSSPSMLMSGAQLAGLVGPAGPQTVPSGTEVRVGAPDPGLPADALDVLRRAVRSDAAVQAAYQLAMSVAGGPIELVVGVEATPPHGAVAEDFADTVLRADEGFRGIAFVDLDGSLLQSARQAVPALD